jgi:hypothetical protein
MLAYNMCFISRKLCKKERERERGGIKNAEIFS